MNSLAKLKECGQSIWFDYIRRDILDNGMLKDMIESDGIRGVTSNPTIFDKAISGSDLYDQSIRSFLEGHPHATLEGLYEYLVLEDIRQATDILSPVYRESAGKDGFVSLEVSPRLAWDTERTIEEARRLWQAASRPNLMIKVPATKEGIPAIEKLLSEGINVNITLMFSLDHYEAVSRAYLNALEKAPDPSGIASVASFFVSRVDTAVDKALEKIGSPDALELCGKIAVANSKLTYKRFKEIFDGPEFARLKEKGARVQRPLWASTSTKNPDYPDVLYVDNLIGPDTVNTLPPATVEAFRDHGNPSVTVDQGVKDAEKNISRLKEVGVDLREITEKLQKEGVRKFIDSFDQLLETLRKKRRLILP